MKFFCLICQLLTTATLIVSAILAIHEFNLGNIGAGLARLTVIITIGAGAAAAIYYNISDDD
ncbi:MAG: hypothetical protein IJ774_07600 [Selenomonadaceae bacterium]|nr:hypothetical protein [Selenomonadaceae bacterium]MBR1806233.1 hypothetical protein [Selenomonadaceae bacterium]